MPIDARASCSGIASVVFDEDSSARADDIETRRPTTATASIAGRAITGQRNESRCDSLARTVATCVQKGAGVQIMKSAESDNLRTPVANGRRESHTSDPSENGRSTRAVAVVNQGENQSPPVAIPSGPLRFLHCRPDKYKGPAGSQVRTATAFGLLPTS